MFVLARALTYASLFIGFFLFFLPTRVLVSSGIGRPSSIGPFQVAGAITTLLGGALAVWCVLTFALVGRGTPAPFDPPRRLVTAGPYRFVRNPMYVGATMALGGAAAFYQSSVLGVYAIVFLAVMLAFVSLYEEPTLRALFGADYDAYCRRVGRWIPRPRSRGDR